MTIGSTANLAAAYDVLRTWRGRSWALEPVHRLALMLLADRFGAGAALVDFGEMHHLLGTDDPSVARSAIEWLARSGLVRLSDWRGDSAFAGSTIATEQEIADARRSIGCDWPFENWAGKT